MQSFTFEAICMPQITLMQVHQVIILLNLIAKGPFNALALLI